LFGSPILPLSRTLQQLKFTHALYIFLHIIAESLSVSSFIGLSHNNTTQEKTDSAKKATSRHASQEMQEQEDHEEEELVYTGAQILPGNLDKQLHSFAGVVVNNSSNADKVTGRQNRQEEDIIGELRGGAILEIFNLGEGVERCDSREHATEVENNRVERATFGLESDDTPFAVAFNGQRDGMGGDPMRKLLYQRIISIARVYGNTYAGRSIRFVGLGKFDNNGCHGHSSSSQSCCG
jgi:hypothetical protein